MSNYSYRVFLALCSVFLAGCVLLFVVNTWWWPLMGDAGLMHYIVFLMDHGMAPYRDIVDPNLPATLMIESAVMHGFGGGSLVWRLFDLGLLAVTGAAMLSIARPYGWFAGLFAASLFALVHGRDGVMMLGQRDLTMTACLTISYAFLFAALRGRRGVWSIAWRMAAFGFFCAAAGMIKPSVALLPVVLVVMAAVRLRRRGQRWLGPVLFSTAGALVPIVLCLVWVWRRQAGAAFFAMLFELIPYFAHLGARSLGHLVLHSIYGVLLPVVLVWAVMVGLQVWVWKVDWLSWERAALLVGMCFGLASFYMQRKGYPYHRYPSEAFLLLLAGIEFTSVFHGRLGRGEASESKPRRHWGDRRVLLERLAAAGILLGTVLVAGGCTAHALRQDWRNHEFDSMLQADLNRLGGHALDGRVQCLDMGDGCIPTLYNMRMVQATGFLYDCYMFSTVEGAERERYREAFWKAIAQRPPEVFVVTSNDCEIYPEKPSYHYQKMGRWPQFEQYLMANYRLEAERVPPHMVNTGSSPSKPLGYRIYVWNH
ncbi:MAG: hypothetical protein M3Y50_06410 [Acidobacteriota bacterium]|nr:hypothetical protein [Acidobacteriota bacterium]